jgi:phage terminase large subunit
MNDVGVPLPKVTNRGRRGGGGGDDRGPARIVPLQLPRKLAFLVDRHAYKVAYGGRSSLKSWNFARALLTLGIQRDLRILCLREVQKSLADSVHLLLSDQIKQLGYEDLYHVTDNAIRGTVRNTLFRFSGLSDQTSESMKSYEGFDIFWFEEAQRISKRSFQIALPTLFRVKEAEAWVSFNPELDTDEVWDRFIMHPPEGAVVAEMNWRDAVACGWMTEENERLRQYDLIYAPEQYDNIWEGRPRTFVAGAIYGREITDLVRSGRYRPMPYDPRLAVHRVWDLGWNDLMTVLLVQKPVPSAISIINYVEESQATYAEMLQTMDGLRYRWGTDWLPHDAVQHHPTSGTNAVQQLRGLGCRVRVIARSDVEARIRAARMMFPRIYLDSTKRETPPDRPVQLIGGAHVLDHLKRYRRNVPKATNEPTTPLHDVHSHCADAFGGLAEIVDQIRNEGDVPEVRLPVFVNPEPSMGLLG